MSKKNKNKNKETAEAIEDVLNNTFKDKQQEENKASDKNIKKEKKSKDEQIAELQETNSALNDKFLRLFSDFDNYRKRTNAEKLDLIKTASRDVIEGMLPVLDDFERAIQAMKDHNTDEESIKGVELIYNKMFGFLKQQGLTPMNSMGTEFNTDYHEAITEIPAPSEDLKGKVVDVVQKGYLLGDKIIRYAKVVIGS